MTLRNVARTFTLDQARIEFNFLATDVNTLSTTLNEQIDDRVSSLLIGGTGVSTSYNDVANSLTLSLDFTEFDTTSITEGTNLYYTDERVDDRVSSLLIGGTGVSTSYNDVANSLTLSLNFTEFDTTSITEGTNLYYTQARFDTAFTAKSTTNLSEGTNLYYTQARFDTAFTAKSTTNLSEGTNLYYTQARFDTAFTAKSTTNLSEGTNLYYTSTRANTDIDSRVTKSFVELLDISVGKISSTAAPSTATSTGTAGEIRYDAQYIYICVATDTWKRVAISTWP